MSTAATLTAPTLTSQINNDLYVGQPPIADMQTAIDYIAGNPAAYRVIVPAGYTGSDNITDVTGGRANITWEDRRGAAPLYYAWNGTAYALVAAETEGDVLISGNLDVLGNLTVTPPYSTSTTTSEAAGLTVAWNMSGGYGETDFIDSHPAGILGGFHWFDVAPGDTVDDTSTPLMILQTGPVQLSVNGAVVADLGQFDACNVLGNLTVSPPYSTSTTPEATGLTAAWNMSGGNGETDLINSHPAGILGGFHWFDVAPGDTIDDTSTPLMVLQTGPVQLSVDGAMVASYGQFDTCDVDGSPVRTFANTPNGGGGGGATIPATTNLIKGDGAGNGADSGITQDASKNVIVPANLAVTGTLTGGDGGRAQITSEGAGYSCFTFNGDNNNGTRLGFIAGGTAAPDTTLYLDVPSGGRFTFRANNSIFVVMDGAAKSLTVTGDFSVSGAKNFVIRNPFNADQLLTHSVVEGPECAVFYRGEGVTADGIATIMLPDYFEALVRPEASTRSVLLTAIFEDDVAEEFGMLAAGRVINGQFSVRSSLPVQKFWWEVKAVRGDIAPLEVVKQVPPVMMPAGPNDDAIDARMPQPPPPPARRGEAAAKRGGRR
jgi:hypothetical protein